MVAITNVLLRTRRLRRALVLIALASAGLSGCGVIQEVIEEQLSDTDMAEGSSSDGMDSTADSTGDPNDGDDETASEPSSTGTPLPDPPLQCSEAAISIPDDGTPVESTVPVQPPDGPSTLAIGVRVAHPDVSELRIELLDQDGSPIALLDQSTCDGTNIDAFFTDAATVDADGPCMGTTSAIEGDVLPLEPLSPLRTVTEPQIWTLRVQDPFPGNGGSLDRWCVVQRPVAE